jgi:hypothetical protein
MKNIDWSKIPLRNYNDLSNEERYKLFKCSTKSYFEGKKCINLLGCIMDKMAGTFIEIPDCEQCDSVINDYLEFIKNELLKNLSKP